MATFKEIKEKGRGESRIEFEMFPNINISMDSNSIDGLNPVDTYVVTTNIKYEKSILRISDSDDDLPMAIIKLMKVAHREVIKQYEQEIEDLKKQITL